MAIPIWITAAGTIAEIDEGVAYSLTLSATDSDNDTLTYTVVAGALPDGLTLATNGIISGTPDEVARRTEKQFVVRVTDGVNSVDRTFKLFVLGSDAPTWSTSAGSLGIIQDGEFFDYQLQASDADNDIKFYKIISGELPDDVTLDTNTGKLSGLILPVAESNFDSTNLGWDVQAWDTYYFDHIVRTGSIDRLYGFTVRVSDGVSHSDRVFTIDVRGTSNKKTDTDQTSADNTLVTADESDVRPMHFVQPAGELARITHENYQIVNIDVVDPDDALGAAGATTLTYELLTENADSTVSELPTGMILDTATGEVYGSLTSFTPAETKFTFTVRVTKSSPLFVDQTVDREFNIVVLGSAFSSVTWNAVDRELVL